MLHFSRVLSRPMFSCLVWFRFMIFHLYMTTLYKNFLKTMIQFGHIYTKM